MSNENRWNYNVHKMYCHVCQRLSINSTIIFCVFSGITSMHLMVTCNVLAVEHMMNK